MERVCVLLLIKEMNNMTDLQDNKDITVKDLLNMYLRELETTRDTIKTLENKIEREFDKMDADQRQYKTTTDDTIDSLTQDIRATQAALAELSLKIVNLIHEMELDTLGRDNQHDLEIDRLKRQTMVVAGGIGGAATTLIQAGIEILKLYMAK